MPIELNATHDPARRSWLKSANAPGTDFPIQNLPFGVFRQGGATRGGLALGGIRGRHGPDCPPHAPGPAQGVRTA